MRNFILYLIVISKSIGIGLAQSFTEVSRSVGINTAFKSNALMGGGVAFFDYNNDGYLDLYVTRGAERDHLYLNNGNGQFTEVGEASGLLNGEFYTMGVTTGDINNDGYADIFVTTWGKVDSRFARNLLYKNLGDGTFVEIGESAGIIEPSWSSSASFGDVNSDGLIDIYVANYVESHGSIILDNDGNVEFFAPACFRNFLYINKGGERFEESALTVGGSDAGGCGLATTMTDYDGDGQVDILVANDFGWWAQPNKLFKNASGKLNDVSGPSHANLPMFGMGIAKGDYDEDGYQDYYVTNIRGNVLMHNNGDGTFSDHASIAGVENIYTEGEFTTGWGAVFFDYNNDSYLDLAVSNGYVATEPIIVTAIQDQDKFYQGNSDGTFTDVSNEVGFNSIELSRGIATGDFDNDGDLDIAVAVIDTYESVDPHLLLYRNNSTANNWVNFKLEGIESTRDAIGSKVTVYANNRTLFREVDGGSSFASQNSKVLHFGLGAIDRIDSVEIRWSVGRVQKLYDLEINKQHLIEEDISSTIITDVLPEAEVEEIKIFPNPVSNIMNIEVYTKQPSRVSIQVLNNMGTKVLEKTTEFLETGHHSFSILLHPSKSGLAKGVYYCKVQTSSSTYFKKIIISE